jgi:hypothetical protein
MPRRTVRFELPSMPSESFPTARACRCISRKPVFVNNCAVRLVLPCGASSGDDSPPSLERLQALSACVPIRSGMLLVTCFDRPPANFTAPKGRFTAPTHHFRRPLYSNPMSTSRVVKSRTLTILKRIRKVMSRHDLSLVELSFHSHGRKWIPAHYALTVG